MMDAFYLREKPLFYFGIYRLWKWIGEFTFKGLLIKSGDVKARNVENRIPFRSFKISMIIVLSSVLSALFIGYYNYAAAGAYNSSFPGVDVPHYVKDLNYMLNSSLRDGEFIEWK